MTLLRLMTSTHFIGERKEKRISINHSLYVSISATSDNILTNVWDHLQQLTTVIGSIVHATFGLVKNVTSPIPKEISGYNKLFGPNFYLDSSLFWTQFSWFYFCQTPVLGLGLGVDFTFTLNNNDK